MNYAGKQAKNEDFDINRARSLFMENPFIN